MHIRRNFSVFIFLATFSCVSVCFAEASSQKRKPRPVKSALTCSEEVKVAGGFLGRLTTRISFRGKTARVSETIIRSGNEPFGDGSNQREFTLEVRSIYSTDMGHFVILRPADRTSLKIFVILVKSDRAYLRSAELAQYDPLLTATMIELITAETNSGTKNWNTKVDPEAIQKLLRNRNIRKLKPENFVREDFERPSSGE